MSKTGPRKGSGGRPKKPIFDKIIEGNLGKRPLKVLDFPAEEVSTFEAPAFLIDATRATGDWPSATETFNKTVEWIAKSGCLKLIQPDHIEEYALCKARWYECEQANAKVGLLAKHPTTGQPMQSPYVQMATAYLKQSDDAWEKIYDVVRDNCTNEFGKEATPHDDIMERILRRRGN